MGCRNSGSRFNQFYLDNQNRGLVSIIALYASSTEQLVSWSEEIGADAILLLDENQGVYHRYHESGGRPQYVVIDSDMTIMLKTINQNSAESKVLELLD